MIYKDFKGLSLSQLGMGNMRLPTKFGRIDQKKAQEIIDYAMEQGINYYDTAYVYHMGKSEPFLGNALKKYPRESYYLATKFYVMANPNIEKVFEEQLKERQRTKIKSGNVLMPQRTNHAPRGKVKITVQGSKLPYIAIQGQAALYHARV